MASVCSPVSRKSNNQKKTHTDLTRVKEIGFMFTIWSDGNDAHGPEVSQSSNH